MLGDIAEIAEATSTERNLVVRILILSAVIAGMLILAFRKKVVQKTTEVKK